MSVSLSEKMTYLLIDTHNHALAQTALRNSQIAFPLKNRLVFSVCVMVSLCLAYVSLCVSVFVCLHTCLCVHA